MKIFKIIISLKLFLNLKKLSTLEEGSEKI